MRATLYDKPEIEYLDGVGYAKMSPKRSHSMVQSALLRLIGDRAGARGQSGTEWRFRLALLPKRDVFVPDVAYVSMERLRALSEADREEPPFAPDISVEVRSPGESARVRERKIVKYLSAGSVLVLDADPQTRRIVAHAADGARTYERDAHFQHPAVPWLRFDVQRVFADLDLPD